ncbi:MAG: hypothetical protein KatS3mg033_0573 [Thermonema sp.]|uniref:hypothetical protein n=1 Tax=Thermonema sp. TaxID=2231181 RepID=UPI0021DC9698|nr:hypothetical protein [Thermonema sp.]GIV38773.1 MAG: hypothetical protein KatS3mg033_0573 [Thermonema sp.]
MLLQIVADGGPMYQETLTAVAEQVVIEPWNAISSLALCVPAIYWFLRIREHLRRTPVLFLCCLLLFLNGVGSTLFHAFRVSRWFLWMDALPALLLTLTLAGYFWRVWLQRLVHWWGVIGVFLLLVLVLGWLLKGSWYMNTQYLLRGIFLLLPTWGILRKTHFMEWRSLAIAGLFLSLSLGFRLLDKVSIEWLPMGTHFLWHLMSAVGAWFLGKYLLSLEHYFLHRR